jgi:hypothetical protein
MYRGPPATHLNPPVAHPRASVDVVALLVELVVLGGCVDAVTWQSRKRQMPHGKQDADQNMLIKYLLFV